MLRRSIFTTHFPVARHVYVLMIVQSFCSVLWAVGTLQVGGNPLVSWFSGTMTVKHYRGSSISNDVCEIGAQVRCEWGISPSGESLITSIVFCGTMAGAYGWGVLGDARGRRIGFAATAAFTFAFGILSAAAPNYLVRFSPLQTVQDPPLLWYMAI